MQKGKGVSRRVEKIAHKQRVKKNWCRDYYYKEGV